MIQCEIVIAKKQNVKKEQLFIVDVRLSLLLHLFKRHNLFIKI